MSALAQLQRDFMEALDREEPGAAKVHRRNVRSARHDALAATYPVVRRLVGDAFFRALSSLISRTISRIDLAAAASDTSLSSMVARDLAELRTRPYLADYFEPGNS